MHASPSIAWLGWAGMRVCMRFKTNNMLPLACSIVHAHPNDPCRAPIMVALSLMELGAQPEDAVQFIRDRRKGAINSK